MYIYIHVHAHIHHKVNATSFILDNSLFSVRNFTIFFKTRQAYPSIDPRTYPQSTFAKSS